jgi:hypothetical protein
MKLFIILIPYMLLLLCGIGAILFDLNILRSRGALVKKAANLSLRLFDLYNIRLAVITVFVSAILYFIDPANTVFLVVSTVLTVISFAVEGVRVYKGDKIIKTELTTECGQCKILYAYLDTWTAVQDVSKKIMTQISDEREISSQIALKERESTSTVIENINDYLSYQQNECRSLLECKTNFENTFGFLADSASMFSVRCNAVIKKLKYFEAALTCMGDSEKLINDARVSFREAYNKNNENVVEHIFEITSQLNNQTARLAIFQDFPKNYTDVTGYYNRRIVSVINAMEEAITDRRHQITNLYVEYWEYIISQKKDMSRLYRQAADYLLKNIFVLTKIVETYDSANTDLKDLIRRKKEASRKH